MTFPHTRRAVSGMSEKGGKPTLPLFPPFPLTDTPSHEPVDDQAPVADSGLHEQPRATEGDQLHALHPALLYHRAIDDGQVSR